MELTNPQVEVLMATWNGASFLEEQLDSLFGQTFRDFRLIVRDDGSADATLEIVERYKANYPGQVVIERNPERLGPCRNFAMLAQESTAPYVAFCDQDDIWREDKIATSLAAMKTAEKEHGTEVPVLVFSDMTLVDEKRRMLVPSLWKMAHLDPQRANLGSMLVQNLVTGCTAMANRSLIRQASPIPQDAQMHDVWLGLVAAAFGILRPLNDPMVQYRQHERNAVGTGRRWEPRDLLTRLRRDYQMVKERIQTSRTQSERFARRYEKQLTDQQKMTLEIWSKSKDLPPVVRQWTLHRRGLRGTTLHNHLGFLARV
jgi:glycosyltransferase involved in cell wall biosynthesis